MVLNRIQKLIFLSSALSNRENDFLLKQLGTSLSWEIPKNDTTKTQTFKCFVNI